MKSNVDKVDLINNVAAIDSKIEKDKKRKMSNREFLDKLNEMDNLW